jgi:hypothetical protein
MGESGLGSSGSEHETVTDSCEHCDETSGSLKCWEFHDQLRNYELIKDSAASEPRCCERTVANGNETILQHKYFYIFKVKYRPSCTAILLK